MGGTTTNYVWDTLEPQPVVIDGGTFSYLHNAFGAVQSQSRWLALRDRLTGDFAHVEDRVLVHVRQPVVE